MRKYLAIAMLILAFCLTVFTQNFLKFKIEDFVQAKVYIDKTAIYVGDKLKLYLEIIYPKDWGIEILAEDLEKNSIGTALPDSIVLEKAKVFSPAPCGDYRMKLKAVYTLFYPEKKHKIGILFNPIKIRFKLTEKGNKQARKEVRVYEVETMEFVLTVNSTLSATSNDIRDSKTFSRNFTLKIWTGLILGLIFILFGLSIPIKRIISFITHRQKVNDKKLAKQRLKNEYQKLQELNKVSKLEDFNDSFFKILKNLIQIRTDIKVFSLTAAELKKMVVGMEKPIIDLAEILEICENLGYNPKAKVKIEQMKKKLHRVEKIVCDWIGRRRKKWFSKN